MIRPRDPLSKISNLVLISIRTNYHQTLVQDRHHGHQLSSHLVKIVKYSQKYLNIYYILSPVHWACSGWKVPLEAQFFEPRLDQFQHEQILFYDQCEPAEWKINEILIGNFAQKI